jgi:ribonuclease D
MKIEASITKDAINEMPISCFEGKVVVVNSLLEATEAVEYLKEQKILGFDTETKPAFAKGVTHKVALLQIATNDICFLFRLNLIGFPPELEKLLKDKKIKKIGLSLRDDFSALNKRKIFSPESFIDLQTIVVNYGITDLSLQKIYALLFGGKISKSQRLSNWEAEVLSEAQIRYAATDAWATLRIYTKLMEMPKITAVAKNSLPPDIPVFL